jgi:hypothetical protein
MDAGERLIELGFTKHGTCNCNGSFNQKYKRGEWLVYISSTKFKIKKHGSTVKSYSPLEGLEVYLSQAIPNLFTGEQV